VSDLELYGVCFYDKNIGNYNRSSFKFKQLVINPKTIGGAQSPVICHMSLD